MAKTFCVAVTSSFCCGLSRGIESFFTLDLEILVSSQPHCDPFHRFCICKPCCSSLSCTTSSPGPLEKSFSLRISWLFLPILCKTTLTPGKNKVWAKILSHSMRQKVFFSHRPIFHFVLLKINRSLRGKKTRWFRAERRSRSCFWTRMNEPVNQCLLATPPWH